MGLLASIQSKMSVNLVLLSLCTVATHYMYGWIVIALYANITKAISRDYVGALFAATLLLHYSLQQLCKAYKFTPQKWAAVAFTLVELLFCYVYYHSMDGIVVAGSALLSVGIIGMNQLSSVSNKYIHQNLLHSIKKRSQTAEQYNSLSSSWMTLLTGCSLAAQGIGSFKSGWFIHHNVRVYLTAIEDDTNIVIQKYLWLIFLKAVLLLLSKSSAGAGLEGAGLQGEKGPQGVHLQGQIDASSHPQSNLTKIIDGFIQGLLSQVIFVYFLFRFQRMFYQEIGKILLIINGAVGLFVLASHYMKDQLMTAACGTALIIISGLLVNWAIIDVPNSVVFNCVAYLIGALLLSKQSQTTDKFNVVGYAAAMIGVGLVFGMQLKSVLMGSIVYFALGVKVAQLIVHELIGLSNKPNPAQTNERFQEVEDIQMESTSRRI